MASDPAVHPDDRSNRSDVADSVRLLLDVDGVLNPVGARCPDWQEWNVTKCRGLPITHSLELGRAIAELDVEVIWLSTWRDEANKWIGPLFGWPGHSVILVDDEDMLSWRSWWKLDAAKKLYAEEPRPFIWADDDLGTMAEAYEWCRDADGLPIVPRSEVGLTPAQLIEMREYVTKRSR